MIHELKILPKYFWEVKSGKKNFEIRKNDRNFREHDILILKEWSEETGYTGEEIERSIGYIYQGDGSYGLSAGYCVLGLKRGRPNAVLDNVEY